MNQIVIILVYIVSRYCLILPWKLRTKIFLKRDGVRHLLCESLAAENKQFISLESTASTTLVKATILVTADWSTLGSDPLNDVHQPINFLHLPRDVSRDKSDCPAATEIVIYDDHYTVNATVFKTITLLSYYEYTNTANT